MKQIKACRTMDSLLFHADKKLQEGKFCTRKNCVCKRKNIEGDTMYDKLENILTREAISEELESNIRKLIPAKAENTRHASLLTIPGSTSLVLFEYDIGEFGYSFVGFGDDKEGYNSQGYVYPIQISKNKEDIKLLGKPLHMKRWWSFDAGVYDTTPHHGLFLDDELEPLFEEISYKSSENALYLPVQKTSYSWSRDRTGWMSHSRNKGVSKYKIELES